MAAYIKEIINCCVCGKPVGDKITAGTMETIYIDGSLNQSGATHEACQEQYDATFGRTDIKFGADLKYEHPPIGRFAQTGPKPRGRGFFARKSQAPYTRGRSQ